jgi:hypothetical protein
MDGYLKIIIDFLIYAMPMLICGYIGNEIFEFWGGLVGYAIGGFIGYKIDEMIENPDSKNNNKKPKLISNTNTNLFPGSTIETYVVGVTFENRQDIIDELRTGENLVLERDPSNPYDQNAIKVSAFKNKKIRFWKSIDFEKQVFDTQSASIGFKKIHVGFINREIAKKIAPYFDQYGFIFLPNLAEISSVRNRINGPTGIIIKFEIPNENWRELESSLLKNLHFPLY